MKVYVFNERVLEALRDAGIKIDPDGARSWRNPENVWGFRFVLSPSVPDDAVIVFDGEAVRDFNRRNWG